MDDYRSWMKVDWTNPGLDINSVGQNVVGLNPFGSKWIGRKVGLPLTHVAVWEASVCRHNGVQLRASFKHLRTIVLWCTLSFRGTLNWPPRCQKRRQIAVVVPVWMAALLKILLLKIFWEEAISAEMTHNVLVICLKLLDSPLKFTSEAAGSRT